MAQFDEKRLEIAERVRRELAIENELTRPQARAYVRCLQKTWQVPEIAWTPAETERQLADARRLIHAGEIFNSLQGPESVGSLDCFRRAGEILEWLSRAPDDVTKIVPVEILAAASYQLGALPAMASGLLEQLDPDIPGVALYSAFLRADFDNTLEISLAFWRRHPKLTGREAGSLLATAEDESDEPDRVAWYFAVEVVRCIGLISDCLRRGDSARLALGMAKLVALDEMALRSFSHDVSLIVSLLRMVAERFEKASIYKPLRQLLELNPGRERTVNDYGRNQFARGRGILWTSQLHGLNRLVENGSFALCTPTGSGKTLVANIAIVKELLLKPHEGLAGLALYIVPSRALASEVETKLTAEIGDEIIVTGLYGGTDWGVTDYWLNSEQPSVLVATVEKAEALMRFLAPLLMAKLRLLIIDEAHQVVPDTGRMADQSFSDHSNRSLRLEQLVSRIINAKPNVERIALTAVAGGAANPVARWIEGRADAFPVGVNYRSTRQVIGTLQTAPTAQNWAILDLMNGRPLYIRGQEDPVYLPLRIDQMPQSSPAVRNSLNHFNCVSTLWTAIHLAAEDQRILISVAQAPERTMGWFKDALELPTWANVPAFDMPSGFLLERFREAEAACLDYCGPGSYELFLLRRGIATNHGQMPQRLRRLMVELIERRICPITVATATLTEGVNLPFDLIFLTSLKRTSWDEDEDERLVEPISTSEFRNLAGRAGRPGASKGIEGLVLISIPTAISTTAAGQRRTQRRQLAALNNDYDTLRTAILLEEADGLMVESPLARLLTLLRNQAGASLGITPANFVPWLEQTAPTAVSPDVGSGQGHALARIADGLDELDGVILAAIEEVARIEDRVLTGSEVEELLISLWSKTFTAVAAVQEAWMNDAFIRRGRLVFEDLYPDPAERRRLYQYGFAPCVGRRFEHVAPLILQILEESDNYGAANPTGRIEFFARIIGLLRNDRGFGFRARNTVGGQFLFENWANVLNWWLQIPGALGPAPEDLRAWQRFVSDNIEFKLGVAIGAAVAGAWNDGADDAFTVPSLAVWRETTGLPWFGFWARELLRWGTLDPFVAFCLAQGLAPTREAASLLRREFDNWLFAQNADASSEDLIDPQLFIQWQDQRRRQGLTVQREDSSDVASLTGTDGRRQQYRVLPILTDNDVKWVDPAGFELATSPQHLGVRPQLSSKNDYILIAGANVAVHRTFRGRFS
jgi:hypothetical protein